MANFSGKDIIELFYAWPPAAATATWWMSPTTFRAIYGPRAGVALKRIRGRARYLRRYRRKGLS